MKDVRINSNATKVREKYFQQNRAFYARKIDFTSNLIEIACGLAEKEGKNILQLYSEYGIK